MSLRKSTLLFILAMLLLLAVDRLSAPKRVKASSDCPVLSATPNADGTTTVVFDCGADYITIQEPVWP